MIETTILKNHIETAFRDRSKLVDSVYRDAVFQVLKLLDNGQLRVATPPSEEGGAWMVNAWVKEAILLYFSIQKMQRVQFEHMEYYDKIPLKKNLHEQEVRLVPPGAIRYGAFLEPGCIVMPGYVNIGAYVGARTMVDTWATVGSCAQIGSDVHLSGGVGIGGVLEPPSEAPVIVENGAFLGSRAIVVEGVRIGREAVIGAGVTLTASTSILDVSTKECVEYKGYVPPRSVVIPGTRSKEFPGGTFGVPCALIIGKRKESTDKKVSLNQALRDFSVPV